MNCVFNSDFPLCASVPVQMFSLFFALVSFMILLAYFQDTETPDHCH